MSYFGSGMKKNMQLVKHRAVPATTYFALIVKDK